MSRYVLLLIYTCISFISNGQLLAQILTTEMMCREAGVLNPDELIKQDVREYHSAKKDNKLYAFFLLAERVSANQIYKKDKNRAVLQLACLEQFATQAEIDSAVKDAYQHWKSGKPFLFDICKYNTSNAGAGFCAQRWSNEQEKIRNKELDHFAQFVSGKVYQEIRQDYELAASYFELKAYTEEMEGGSGVTVANVEFINNQKDLYIRRIENTLNGVLPENFPDLTEVNRQLNRCYQQLRERLMIKSITGFETKLEFIGLRKVQACWEEYREKTAMLLITLNNKTTTDQWRALLTTERMEELNYLLEYSGD